MMTELMIDNFHNREISLRFVPMQVCVSFDFNGRFKIIAMKEYGHTLKQCRK